MSTSTNIWDEAMPKPAEEMKVYLANLPDFVEGSKRCAFVLLYS